MNNISMLKSSSSMSNTTNLFNIDMSNASINKSGEFKNFINILRKSVNKTFSNVNKGVLSSNLSSNMINNIKSLCLSILKVFDNISNLEFMKLDKVKDNISNLLNFKGKALSIDSDDVVSKLKVAIGQLSFLKGVLKFHKEIVKGVNNLSKDENKYVSDIVSKSGLLISAYSEELLNNISFLNTDANFTSSNYCHLDKYFISKNLNNQLDKSIMKVQSIINNIKAIDSLNFSRYSDFVDILMPKTFFDDKSSTIPILSDNSLVNYVDQMYNISKNIESIYGSDNAFNIIVDNICITKNKDLKFMEFELHPKSLGKVKIELSLEKGSLKGMILCSNINLKNYTIDNLDFIKSLLVDKGVSFDDLGVSDYSSSKENNNFNLFNFDSNNNEYNKGSFEYNYDYSVSDLDNQLCLDAFNKDINLLV